MTMANSPNLSYSWVFGKSLFALGVIPAQGSLGIPPALDLPSRGPLRSFAMVWDVTVVIVW